MKAIIIAGGQGLRLRPYTELVPKCFLKVNNKSILDWILESFGRAGIRDIIVVTGYKGELIKTKYSYLKFYDDSHYEKSSILRGLFCAQKEMDDSVIISYSDIIYDDSVIKKLSQDDNDFSLIIDREWRKLYVNRNLHPLSEAEKVIVRNDCIVEIGKQLKSDLADGEFIGLAKFSKKGAKVAVRVYNELFKKNAGKPFQNAQEFERAYLTDFFQELIDRNYKISPVFINGNWLEIDTPEDLEGAQKKIVGSFAKSLHNRKNFK